MKLTRYMKQFDIDESKKLLINTITGAVDIIDNDVLLSLESHMDDSNESDIVRRLKQRGYIVRDDHEDYERLNKIVNQQSRMCLATFIICITYQCNLSCTYCFEPTEVKEKLYKLNMSDVDKIFIAIEKIMQERAFTNASILLYGGEPFLPNSREIVNYIMEKAQNNKYIVQAISNGTNLKQYKNILFNYKNIIHNIQITLDGDQKYHDMTRKYHSGKGSFDDVVAGIDLCMNLGIPVNLRINVGKKNIKGLDGLLALIEHKGWCDKNNFICQLAPITDHYCTNMMDDWIPEYIILPEIAKLIENHKRINIKMGTDMEKRVSILKNVLSDHSSRIYTCIPCSAALRNYFVFGAEGLIYACPETVGITDQSIGMYKPYFEIVKKKEDIWRRNISNINKCKQCEMAGICGSGCTWSSIATNGKKFEEPQCNYAHETIETFFQINKDKFSLI